MRSTLPRLLLLLLLWGGLLGPSLACGYIPQTTYEKARKTAQAFGIPPNLLVALVWVESRFCKGAVGGAGEVGLGQVLPSTAQAMGIPASYLWHEDWNLYASARYLRMQYDRFRDWRKALIAYNAGPGRVDNPPYSSVIYARDVLYVYEYLERVDRARGRRQ